MIAEHLVAALDAVLDVKVYPKPVNQPAVPSAVVMPASTWAERVDGTWCGPRWTYEVLLLAKRVDVDGAWVELEELVLAAIQATGPAFAWTTVRAPTVRDVGGVDVLACVVTYELT